MATKKKPARKQASHKAKAPKPPMGDLGLGYGETPVKPLGGRNYASSRKFEPFGRKR